MRSEILYRIITQCYYCSIWVAAKIGHQKAKKWLQHRKQIWENLEDYAKGAPQSIIWFHCASRGETEQAIPLIRELKSRRTTCNIVLSIFSPSGERDIPEVDFLFHLPTDTPKHAKRIISLLKPSLVVFVKYDLWYYYLKTIHEQGIPSILISAIFRQSQLFFRKNVLLRKIPQKMLSYLSSIYVQDEKSKDLLHRIGLKNHVYVCGDTRYDQVQHYKKIQPPQLLYGEKRFVIVCGSTWDNDHRILKQAIRKMSHCLFVVAPHEVDERRIRSLENIFPGARRLSAISREFNKSNVLIIDCLGQLNAYYSIAQLAYVGGGFSKSGIHNILEPAVHAIPVLFGPKYQKYQEAIMMLSSHTACCISNSVELEQAIFHFIKDKKHYQQTCEKARTFMKENIGATKRIAQHITSTMTF